MISKELLTTIREDNYTVVDTDYFYEIDDKKIGYLLDNEQWYYISIYELAHKCKEWALSKGYSLYSGYDKLINKYGVYVNLLLLGDDELTIGGWDTEIYFIANTEPEAIFKACKWIMENKCGN